LNLTLRYKTPTCLSGSILLSHPNLLDPNFSSSILFLSSHSDEQGSLGVILNRPIGQTLGELDSSFLTKPFSGVPVFEGGPVEQDKLIVAAWEWLDSPSSFKLYFGIDLEKAETLKQENSSIEVACFLGHSGWSPGQLEEELEQESWLVAALDHELFSQMKQKKEIWKKTVGSISDELKLLVDCPENPMNN
jgi:putative transcriptional regulator